MKHGLIIEPIDNVVVVTEDIAKGDVITYTLDGVSYEIRAEGNVPVYHKIARADIAKGEKVIKYGQIIGVATEDIPAGTHVHIHNVKSMSMEVH